jgi:hypothetical protein
VEVFGGAVVSGEGLMFVIDQLGQEVARLRAENARLVHEAQRVGRRDDDLEAEGGK